MNINNLEIFLLVAEYKSFSKVANKLYFTQPSISSKISSLEAELNCKLFKRNTKNIELTDNGKKLLPYAKEICKIRKEIENSFYIVNDNIIAIATSSVPNISLLPSVMKDYSKDNDDYKFKIFETNSSNVETLVSEGTYPFGFCGSSSFKENCDYYKVDEDEIVIITPAHHRFNKEKSELSLERLKTEPIILREAGSGTRIEVENYLSENGLNEDILNIIGSFNNGEIVKKSVEKNLGISFLSKISVEEEVKEGKIYSFKFPGTTFKRDLYFVVSKEYELKDYEKKFYRFMMERVKNSDF